ncbi:MAG: hypothetical protein MJA29_11530 [Candidatus Omnitrophica bacterium]|nr:hypothetical protein [Candidatus Omnitrophota bacterium]
MTKQIKDGGPAYPVPVVINGGLGTEFTIDTPGMSLRDYFIAHAPASPPDWFQPKMDPMPTSHGLEYCEGCMEESDCLGNADCDEINDIIEARHVWEKEERKQKSLQWPIFWADAMLEARENDQTN